MNEKKVLISIKNQYKTCPNNSDFVISNLARRRFSSMINK